MCVCMCVHMHKYTSTFNYTYIYKYVTYMKQLYLNSKKIETSTVMLFKDQSLYVTNYKNSLAYATDFPMNAII